jgi:chaperonin GroES
MQPNRQYFTVKIDHQLQAQKRERIVLGGTATLGIRYAPSDYKGPGLPLSGVEVGGPAYSMGIKAGDILTHFEGVAITTLDQLSDLVATHAPGEEVTLQLINHLMPGSEPSPKKVKLGEKKIDLENPAHLRDMRHNLQFGEILDYGREARAAFPHAKVGDTLIFHHSVEFKSRSENDPFYNDMHLVDHAGKDEIRIVNYEFEILGVIQMDTGKLVPHPKWVFCHQQMQKASIQRDPKTGLWLPDHWEKTMEDYTRELDELTAQVKEVQTSTILTEKTSEKNYRRKEEIIGVINLLNKERAGITKKMHQKKLVEVTVLHFNPRSAETLGYKLVPGDKVFCDYYSLYPLDLMGTCFSLARVQSIECGKLQTPPKPSKHKKRVMTQKFNPLHDRIIIAPDAAEVVSEGGIIIPETARERPARGEVIAAGPGSPERPMQARVGDVVLYSKYSGTEVEYDGQKIVFMREDDILTTLSPEEAARAKEDNKKRIEKNKELRMIQEATKTSEIVGDPKESAAGPSGPTGPEESYAPGTMAVVQE